MLGGSSFSFQPDISKKGGPDMLAEMQGLGFHANWKLVRIEGRERSREAFTKTVLKIPLFDLVVSAIEFYVPENASLPLVPVARSSG